MEHIANILFDKNDKSKNPLTIKDAIDYVYLYARDNQATTKIAEWVEHYVGINENKKVEKGKELQVIRKHLNTVKEFFKIENCIYTGQDTYLERNLNEKKLIKKVIKSKTWEDLGK